MAVTTYVVLHETEDGTWKELGVSEGPNDLAAIKQFLERSDGELGAGNYRAVPRRSWPEKPHSLKPLVRWV